MTKYIDRYYLNWEMYAIKFGGGGWGWTPWANTLAYYPLESDVLDYSWNWNNAIGAPDSFADWVANYSWASTSLPTSLAQSIPLTCLIWINDGWIGVWDHNINVMWQHTFSGYGLCLSYNQYDRNNSAYSVGWHTSSNGGNFMWVWTTYSNPLDWWHLMWLTRDWTTLKLYIDWEFIWQDSDSSSATSNDAFYLWYDHGYDWGAWYWKVSKLIFEDKTWTAQEVADYFNQTKSLYGIS